MGMQFPSCCCSRRIFLSYTYDNIINLVMQIFFIKPYNLSCHHKRTFIEDWNVQDTDQRRKRTRLQWYSCYCQTYVISYQNASALCIEHRNELYMRVNSHWCKTNIQFVDNINYFFSNLNVLTISGYSILSNSDVVCDTNVFITIL